MWVGIGFFSYAVQWHRGTICSTMCTVLNPTILHKDSEQASMAGVHRLFSDALVRIWHIRENQKKKLKSLGLGLQNQKTPKYIVDKFEEL